MLRTSIFSLVFVCVPAMGAPIHYDYNFGYQDITDCSLGCDPETRNGSGQILLDSEDFSLRKLQLASADFSISWEGVQKMQVLDEWEVADGSLFSVGTELSLPDYTTSLFLDLFFVPEGDNPLHHFGNATEQYNFVKNGTATWALQGRFMPSADPARVPEPATWLGLGTGLLVFAGLRARRRRQTG